MGVRKIHSVLVILLLLMVSIFTLSYQAYAAAQMPRFVLQSAVDDKEIDSDQFKGNVLLITFFATWCPPCIEEIPALISLQEELNSKNFSVIAISVDDGGSKTVARLIKKTGINYPVVMADSGTARDFGGIVGIPTSFLVNRKGNVVKKYPGWVPHEMLVKDIAQVME